MRGARRPATLARRLCALIALARYVPPAAGVVPGVVVGPGVGVGVPGGSCDARVAPVNGAIGSCVGNLAHGESCAPSCDEGYFLQGAHECRDGTLHEARCLPKDLLTCEALDCGEEIDWDGPWWKGRALWSPPSEWDDPEERAPHVALHDAAMAKYTELLEKRQGSAF